MRFVNRRLLLGLVLLAVSGCTYAPRYDDPHRYRQDYYYYPSIGVYFHLYSGDYFYRDDRRWVRARILPPYIVLDHRLRRPLVIRDPEPYRHHERHRETYRPRADFRRNPAFDRPEREHNERRHREYRDRPPSHPR